MTFYGIWIDDANQSCQMKVAARAIYLKNHCQMVEMFSLYYLAWTTSDDHDLLSHNPSNNPSLNLLNQLHEGSKRKKDESNM